MQKLIWMKVEWTRPLLPCLQNKLKPSPLLECPEMGHCSWVSKSLVDLSGLLL